MSNSDDILFTWWPTNGIYSAKNNDSSVFEGYAFALEWHTFAKGHRCAPNMGSMGYVIVKQYNKTGACDMSIEPWIHTSTLLFKYAVTDLICFVKLSGWKCNIMFAYFVEFRFKYLNRKKHKHSLLFVPCSV